MELERLLRSQGFGSRADCRALVRTGRVRLGDEICDDPFQEVAPDGLSFSVDDTPWLFRTQAYLVLHKPADYECSHKPRFHPSVYSLLPRPLVTRGVQAVGRLDEDTTGLLLLSDDGQFIHRCTSPKKRVAKIYEVTTKHPVDEAQIAALLGGVLLNDDPEQVAALACEKIADNLLRLTITEGKYHQVKRMIAAVSNRVEGLHRCTIGDYALPADLKPGEWRWLDASDLARIETPLDTA
jgi:16S rRNA pseudouridine516 synthase